MRIGKELFRKSVRSTEDKMNKKDSKMMENVITHALHDKG